MSLIRFSKFYMNSNGTKLKEEQVPMFRGQDQTLGFRLISPLEAGNAQFINFLLANKITATKRMKYVGTEEVVIDENQPTETETWNVWEYIAGQDLLNAVATFRSTPLFISFADMVLRADEESGFNFVGFYNDLASLVAAYPTPTSDMYAGVGSSNANTAIAYAVVADEWTSQTVSVTDFEALNSIKNFVLVGKTNQVEVSVNSSVTASIVGTTLTDTEEIFADIAALEAAVTSLEEEIVLKVYENIGANYVQTTDIDRNDLVYVLKPGQTVGNHITFADFIEGGAQQFIGTYDTAAGLVCTGNPTTETDLLCQYPENDWGNIEINDPTIDTSGPFDPTSRLGYFANVKAGATTGGNEVYRWLASSSTWDATGQTPNSASDISFDSSGEPTLFSTNVQDVVLEVNTKVGAALNKSQKFNTSGNLIDGQDIASNDIINPAGAIVGALNDHENKTQNLDSDGNISDNVDIAATKDIASTDITNATGKVIGTLNDHETRMSENEADIAAQEQKTQDISNDDAGVTTIAGKLVVIGGVEFQGDNTKVNTTDLEVEDKVFTVNKGGADTGLSGMEVEGAGAIVGKMHFDHANSKWKHGDENATDFIPTQTEVTTNSAHRTGDGSDHAKVAENAANLALKENLANKTNDVFGNSSSSTKYASTKGVYDHVLPIKLKNDEDTVYSSILQAPGTADFYRTSADTSLYDGRIEYIRFNEVLEIIDQNAKYSVDGGVTLKNIYLSDGSNYNPSLFPTYNARYIDLIFSTVLDGWILVRTNVDFANIVGLDIGWTFGTTVQGNKILISTLDGRVSQLEGGSLSGKSTIANEVDIVNTITGVTSTGVFTKVAFTAETAQSNNRDVLDVDGNFDIIVKEDSEPGYDIFGNFRIVNTGAPSSTSKVTFYLFDDSSTIAAGNELDKFSLVAVNPDTEVDRTKFKLLTNEYVNANLGGFPTTLKVYYTNDNGNPFTILEGALTAEAKFTGIGVSSTENVTLTDSLTETPSGVKTDQSEANKEFTTLHKDHTESGKVIVANYQSNGRYLANKTDIILDINKIITIKFNGSGTDLTELVELSIDNGANYYDVEYRDSTKDLTVKNVTEHIQELYFDGSKFLATFVDDELNITQDYSDIIESTYGVITPSENGSPEIQEINGLSITELVQNPNFDDGTTDWILITSTGSVTSGVYSFTASAQYGKLYQNISVLSGKKYALIAKVKSTSSQVGLGYSTLGTFTTYHSGSGQYEVLSGILTAPATETKDVRIIDTRTSGWDQVDVKYIYAIPLDNTILDGLTASEIASRINYLDFGFNDLENPEIKFTGLNEFDGVWESGKITAGSPVADANYIRTANYITVIEGLTYYISHEGAGFGDGFDRGYAFWDKDLNYITTLGTLGTVVVPSNARYMKVYSNVSTDLNYTMQFEKGTVPTTYKPQNTGTIKFNATPRSVGTSQDKIRFDNDKYVWDKYNGIDYNDVVKNYTAWLAPVDVLTNTHLFRATAIDDVLNYKYAPETSILKIGNIIFKYKATGISTDDEENTFNLASNGTFNLRVNKITYPDVATLISDLLTPNDVEFRFILADDSKVLGNEIDVDGSTVQESVTTIEQLGNFGLDYSVEFAINKAAQIEKNTYNIRQAQRQVDLVEDRVTLIEDRATVVEDRVTVVEDRVTVVEDTAVTLTGNQNITGSKNFSESMGIGTTSPSAKVTIDGENNSKALEFKRTGVLSGNAAFRLEGVDTEEALAVYINDSEKIRVNYLGNVGIGTNNPDGKLHLFGSGVIKNTIESTNNQVMLEFNGATLGQIINQTGSLYITNNSATGDLILRTGTSNERMRINSIGNIGIGTNSPDGKLHLFGSGVIKNIIESTNYQAMLEFNGATLGQIINQTGSLYITNNSATGDLIFGAGSSNERMRINDTGEIDVNSNPIQNLLDPVNAQDAATKKYVDDYRTNIGNFGSSITINGATPVDVNLTRTLQAGDILEIRYATNTDDAGRIVRVYVGSDSYSTQEEFNQDFAVGFIGWTRFQVVTVSGLSKIVARNAFYEQVDINAGTGTSYDIDVYIKEVTLVRS